MSAQLTERDKKILRTLLREQARTAARKNEWRRRRDVKHFWPRIDDSTLRPSR